MRETDGDIVEIIGLMMRPACPADDIPRLDVFVDFVPNHARVRILDADNERWEV